MRRCVLLITCLNILLISKAQISIVSPDGKIKTLITVAGEVRFQIFYNDIPLLNPSTIGLQLSYASTGKTVIASPLVIKKQFSRINNTYIISPVPEKRKNIPDLYNEMTIQFRQPLSLIVRVYNDGCAYRWVTTIKDSIIIKDEIAS